MAAFALCVVAYVVVLKFGGGVVIEGRGPTKVN
jgi:hypothetical protein